MEKVTHKGASDIKLMIEQLKKQLHNTTEDLRKAKEHGDLSENSEYTTTLENKAEIERELGTLDKYLRHAVVVNNYENIDESKVDFGATIEIVDDHGSSKIYTLVGMYEADLDKKTIYYKTPIGIQLINKKVGDTIYVQLDKLHHYTIKSINYSYLKSM